MNTYEIMFLFDPTVGANWSAVESEVNRLMERASAEVILTKRLEERKLAYEIGGCKRGLYVLTYVKAKHDSIGGIERDARLSESILRILILRAEGISDNKMQEASLGGAAHDHRGGRRDDAPAPEAQRAEPAATPVTPEPAEGELVTSASEETKTEV